jgi:ribosome biogenesis GTPase
LLDSYGWSDALQHAFAIHSANGLAPARVIVQQRGLYLVATAEGEASARLSGRFAHAAADGDYPVAGDWVAAALRPQEASATIHRLLPRRSAFVRKAVGGGTSQVVAANVDVAFLVTSLNADLNPRRIERYLATAWDSGASPVIVLTKADLCPGHERDALQARIEAVALGVPVHAVSAVTGEGLDRLRQCFAPGRTAALLGSSGTGKSSLVNALAGAPLMATRAISEHAARGRHTTTHRQLVLLPDRRLVLDTPGMRELGLWEADAGVAATFADIEALAGRCRFGDCAHEAEPGCAVQAALADGSLDAGRWRSWMKLQRELAHAARKDDPSERAALRKVWIQRARHNRARKRHEDEA